MSGVGQEQGSATETAPAPVSAEPGNWALTCRYLPCTAELAGSQVKTWVKTSGTAASRPGSASPAMGTVRADLGRTSVPLSSCCPCWHKAAQTAGEDSCPAWTATGGSKGDTAGMDTGKQRGLSWQQVREQERWKGKGPEMLRDWRPLWGTAPAIKSRV